MTTTTGSRKRCERSQSVTPRVRFSESAARAKLYGEVQTQTQKDNPLIYLYRQRNLTGISKEVSGVQVYADGIIRVAFAGYTK